MPLHAPVERWDGHGIGPSRMALCGRSYRGVSYGDAQHLLFTIAGQDGEIGSGWGDWCKDCRRRAENDHDAVRLALAELEADQPLAPYPLQGTVDYLRSLLPAAERPDS